MTLPDIPEIEKKLAVSANIWMATIRPDQRPHLVPVWFVYHKGSFYICTDPKSVKAGNISHNPAVVLALEDGSRPVICEGTARVVETPMPADVVRLFQSKYDWDITTDSQYTLLVIIEPVKWLSW